MTTLTEQQRDDLKTELDAIDEAEAPIMKLMEPLRSIIGALEQMRDIVLLRYGIAERPEQCEGCECFVLPGDKYCPTTDGGPLCEACAPDYEDMKKQAEEQLANPEESDEHDGAALLLKNVYSHVTDGGALTDKYLLVFPEQ